jgi:hypothetical protein
VEVGNHIGKRERACDVWWQTSQKKNKIKNIKNFKKNYKQTRAVANPHLILTPTPTSNGDDQRFAGVVFDKPPHTLPQTTIQMRRQNVGRANACALQKRVL